MRRLKLELHPLFLFARRLAPRQTDVKVNKSPAGAAT
jgi:hypothetical protein